MQAAQHAPGAAAVVVLDKVLVQTRGLVKGFLVEAFIEEAARITKHLRFDDQRVGDGCWGYFHTFLLFQWAQVAAP